MTTTNMYSNFGGLMYSPPLKLACFVIFVRNREGHLQMNKVGGRQRGNWYSHISNLRKVLSLELDKPRSM